MQKIALVDMDGTVADYDGAMESSYNRLILPGELTYRAACAAYGRMTLPDPLWERCQLIKSRHGWWRDMPMLQVGDQIVCVLRRLGYEVQIATRGPKDHPRAWAEKVQWVRKHMPVGTVVHVTEDKSMLRSDVLVDDWPSYCDKWKAKNPDGLVIMPAHDYNHGCPYFRYELGMQAQLETLLKEQP